MSYFPCWLVEGIDFITGQFSCSPGDLFAKWRLLQKPPSFGSPLKGQGVFVNTNPLVASPELAPLFMFLLFWGSLCFSLTRLFFLLAWVLRLRVISLFVPFSGIFPKDPLKTRSQVFQMQESKSRSGLQKAGVNIKN